MKLKDVELLEAPVVVKHRREVRQRPLCEIVARQVQRLYAFDTYEFVFQNLNWEQIQEDFKIKFGKEVPSKVSRETLKELEYYSKAIIEKNKSINLISKSTEKLINIRHIEDSAQTIDFIDKSDIKTCTDLGSGAGLPGIVLGILMKPKSPIGSLAACLMKILNYLEDSIQYRN